MIAAFVSIMTSAAVLAAKVFMATLGVCCVALVIGGGWRPPQ